MSPELDLDPVLVARFWERVDCRPYGCWRWTGHIHPQTGYGSFTFRGHGWRAHRLSLAIAGRPVPADLDACHTCDNRWCVNPDHLYAGTRSQNMADCGQRDRHNKPSGHAHWSARLSDDDVREIRTRCADGSTQTAVAAAFGVHPATVSRIVRRVWRQEVA